MKWMYLLLVGLVIVLALGLVALWRPLPFTEVVYAGRWCCKQYSEATPLKCTGCQLKPQQETGACPNDAPVILSCPGRTTQTLITGGGELGETVTLLLKPMQTSSRASRSERIGRQEEHHD
jgi:hypothetical protein